MKHPLESLPEHARKPMFYIFFALTMVIFGVFRTAEPYLRTPAAPSGIVSFELARTVSAAQSMIDSWDANAQLYMAFGLGFDYLFMPVYALALSLGLLLAGSRKTGFYHALTAWLGWGAFAAALFDVIENYALWKELIHGVSSPLPEIAAFCATVKFVLLIVGLVAALSSRLFRN